MATKKKENGKSPAPQRLEYDYMRLDELLAHRWDLNPKLHQASAIHQSITDYGFNDPVGYDTKWELVLEGHGRLEDLDARYRTRAEGTEKIPQHIDLDPKDGMWLVPVTKKQFASRELALLYALAHNRTNTSRYVAEDYDPEKMLKIRKLLGDAGQMKLAGFEAEDAIGSGVGMGDFQLPDLKPFDSIDLPDGAGVEGSAPESFVMMVTFRTFMEMKEAIRVLTLGERTTLSQNARLSKFDGSPLLVKWRAMMAGEGLAEALAQAQKEHDAPPASAPLLEYAAANPIPPEQLFSQTERGTDNGLPALMPLEDVVDRAAKELGIDPRTPPEQVDAAIAAMSLPPSIKMKSSPAPAPASYVATEMEVGGSLEPSGDGYVPDWDLAVPLEDDFYKTEVAKPKKAEAAAKKKDAEAASPNWVGGLCRSCGGNGSKDGNPKKGACPSCEGFGTEEAYNARNVEKQGTLL